MTKEIGNCLCGHIEVTCEDLPKNVVACYCKDCQKASGGGPTFNIPISDDLVKITKGQTSYIEVTADSGNSVERHFCGQCGCAIYSKLPTKTVWKAGLFVHVKYLKVVKNIWASTANQLIKVNENITSYEKNLT